MNKIKSLGYLELHNGLKWEISLPLFHRSTIVLFSNLFFFRIASQVPEIFIPTHEGKNREFILDASNIKTTEYINNGSGLFVPSERIVGSFERAGEHSEYIHFHNLARNYINNSKVFENKEKIENIFNQMTIELYQRI